MVDTQLATEEQTRVFGDKWTQSYRLLSRVSYVRASPLRVLFHAFRAHQVAKAAKVNILEYGFGHGHGLFRFAPSASLHGIELSDAAIEAASKKARHKGYSRFEFKRPPLDDPVRIEFPSDWFDVIICSHTVEHVYSDERLLAEFYRVLKPGGKCFLLVPKDVDHRRLLTEEQERQNPDFPLKTYHVWQYNSETFEWLARNAGFTLLEIQSLDAILDQRLGWNRPLQIGAGILFSLLPYRIWQWLDRLSQRRGFRCRQCLVVATKLSSSENSTVA